MPMDIGRLPRRIDTGEGFSSFSADQWKTILVCRLVSKNDLVEAHQRLIEMGKEIERTYGLKKITHNLHLCMYLCECMLDYGPLYAFWYYSIERINGLLGSFQNSHRRIEPELMKIIQNNALLDELTSHSVGSLSIYDEYSDKEYQTFRLLSIKTAEEEFVTLSHIHKTAESSIPVDLNVNQFSRLRIETEIFGSTLSSRHAKSAKILAHFFIDDDTSDIYLERFNNTPLRVPLTDEEEFDPQYKSTLNRSILYYKIQPTASTNSQGESAQEKSETYSLCNEPDPLFEPNGAYLEPV
ncbi:1690_t:CDS:2, partial [Funneliformis geosporum]